MKIALLSNPWAESAANILTVNDADDLRRQLAEIPAQTFHVAVYRTDDAEKPHPAQASRTEFPDCASSDGFGYARTGLQPRHHAASVWRMVEAALDFLDRSDRFLGHTLPEFSRKVDYPGLRAVPEEPDKE